ncbi:MAG: hypothetical protein AAFV29_22820, partial [Myxococcota bacterium]
MVPRQEDIAAATVRTHAQQLQVQRSRPYQPKGTIAPLGPWKTLQLRDLHEHMLVTGAPGSGKTSCVVLPTVRRIVDLGGAVICFTA